MAVGVLRLPHPALGAWGMKTRCGDTWRNEFDKQPVGCLKEETISVLSMGAAGLRIRGDGCAELDE